MSTQLDTLTEQVQTNTTVESSAVSTDATKVAEDKAVKDKSDEPGLSL